jgi:putative spermidine/putrescine transport system ATP-binding protein
MARAFRRILGTVFVVIVLVYLFLPALVVVPLALSTSAFLQFPPPGYSFGWFQQFLDDPAWMTALVRSVNVALGAAAISTLLGCAAAYYITRRKGALATTVEPILILPLAVPVIVFALGAYTIAIDRGVVGNTLMLMTVHAMLALPYAYINIRVGLTTVDPRLEMAAQSLGARPSVAFVRVMLPLLAPALAVALPRRRQHTDPAGQDVLQHQLRPEPAGAGCCDVHVVTRRRSRDRSYPAPLDPQARPPLCKDWEFPMNQNESAASTATDAPPALLQCQGLSKTYRESTTAAVETLHLDVADGEFVTLLGSSGSGKSTTLMMVAGFETPDGGRVRLAGRDITDVPAHKRDFGFVFQSYLLFPHLTVFQNVAFPLRMQRLPKREIKQRVAAVLGQVRLESFADRLPRQLSGGQQQRVAVARAIVGNPKLLLMDEPLGALDERLRYDLQQEIRRLHKDLKTPILYVTHDQHEAMSLSDRIVLMRDGSIEQSGTPADLYERPQTAYVARFMGEATFLRGLVETLRAPGQVGVRLRETGELVETRAAAGVKLGDDVELMLRAAALRIGPGRLAGASATEDTGSGHGFDVTVEDVAYVGEGMRVVGTTRKGEAFKGVASTDQCPRPGDECRVELVSELAWCIPALTSEDAVALEPATENVDAVAATAG